MRIFHGPNNLGGMAASLARAHRSLGHEARALCYPSPTFGLQGDGPWPPPLFQVADLNLSFLRHAARFDVFQFYYSHSLTGMELRDVPWLKRLGKKVFFFFCGCDVRDSKSMIAAHEYSTCAECWPMGCGPNRAQLLEAARRHADACFVSTPDLLEFVVGANLLPQPVEFAALDFAAQEGAAPRGRVRLAHAPTDRQKKGTRHIVAAVEHLRQRGAPVELRLVERTTQAEAIKELGAADIIIDQVMAGSYGMVSVEGMALGKPVVCYLREDLRQHYPEPPPVISAHPLSLERVLGELIASRDAWHALGQSGRQYARRWHDSLAVARRLLDAYAS